MASVMNLCLIMCLFFCVCIPRSESFGILKKIKNALHPTTTSTTVATPVVPDYEKEGENAVEATQTLSTGGEEEVDDRRSSTTPKTDGDSYFGSHQQNEEELTSFATPTTNYEDNKGNAYESSNPNLNGAGKYPGIPITTTLSSNVDYINNQQPANEDMSPTLPKSAGPSDNQFQRPSSGQSAPPVVSQPTSYYNRVVPTLPTYTGTGSRTTTQPTDDKSYNQIQPNQQNNFRPSGNQDKPGQQVKPDSSSDDGPIVFPDSRPSQHDRQHGAGHRRAVYFTLSTTERNVKSFNSNPEPESFGDVGDAISSLTNTPKPGRNLDQYQELEGTNDLGDTRQVIEYSTTSTSTTARYDVHSSSRDNSQGSNRIGERLGLATRKPKKNHVPVNDGGDGRNIIDGPTVTCGAGEQADGHGQCRKAARK